MVYDLSKSISQRSSREKDEENIRIKEIADELSRGCELYEAEFGTGKGHVTHFDIEQRVSERYAESHQTSHTITILLNCSDFPNR